MGYVLRVRLASFFAGAAVASSAGLYILYKDYKLAHHSISDQVGRFVWQLLRKNKKATLAFPSQVLFSLEYVNLEQGAHLIDTFLDFIADGNMEGAVN
uniref:Uncharacterized protein n=1 Tax=Chenopodium quinoa TaxID=63459 RepID=A0A803L2D1_CHEQI